MRFLHQYDGAIDVIFTVRTRDDIENDHRPRLPRGRRIPLNFQLYDLQPLPSPLVAVGISGRVSCSYPIREMELLLRHS